MYDFVIFTEELVKEIGATFEKALAEKHLGSCLFASGFTPFQLSDDYIYLHCEEIFMKNVESFEVLKTNSTHKLPVINPGFESLLVSRLAHNT